MKFCTFACLAVCLFFSTSCGQYLPMLSLQEIDTILSSNTKAEKAVKCIVNFTPGCNPNLQKAYEVAPEIAKNHGKCPSCSPEDEQVLGKFLQGLKTRYPMLKQKLDEGLKHRM